MQKNTYIFILVILILGIAAWGFYVSRTPTPPTGIEDLGMTIRLYFYNPDLDQGPGGVQCTSNGLVAVDRVIPQTTTPLTDAIELLLRGEISDNEKARGIESEFPLPGLTLRGASVDNGVATLTFDDLQNKTVGGSCRIAIL